MGNAPSVTWHRPVEPTDASAMFHTLDVHGNGYLTLKDLMDAHAPDVLTPHSLPALYFFDHEKNGRLVEEEFNSMVRFCQCEKRKVEQALSHDKNFRDLILRASKAGVKDCSMHGRSSYRRLSSYTNVRCVFSKRRKVSNGGIPSSSLLTPLPEAETSSTTLPNDCTAPRLQNSQYALNYCSPNTPTTSTSTDVHRTTVTDPCASIMHLTPVAMYCSERDHDSSSGSAISEDTDMCASDADLRNPQNRTAVDVAVLENVINVNIHKLADLLHTDGSREQFMAWLWELANFNSTGVITLEELRVFLSALSEDGIDLSELTFYREGAQPLEVCIINEFDTTHTGLLSRDEFMVLADLVTREYEFWENRHLERIGDYELGRTIGRGSSGVVRLGIHVENREKFAIKIIKKGKCSDLSRLDREIQSLMSASHEHIVGLEEVLDSDSNIFIIMDLCGGGSMVDIVRLYPEERMPEETTRFFIRQVFEALDFCHRRGICHRDVRLDNLMLDNTGNVKITDFGHSGMYIPGWDLFSTSLVGSVYTLSPEQILGQVYSGEKIDVWAAGVAVYCLLVGEPPFFDSDVTALLERISGGVFDLPDFISDNGRDFIQCMLRSSAEERIPIKKMLHHPWFYDGPEYGPVMDVVNFPVDPFFRKRPDIAEMVLAMTIHQHHLHFHLGHNHNPKSSPDELRGQEWTLRCLCPRNDIKFTVSLFTKKPHAIKKKKKKNGQLPTCASVLALSPPAIVSNNFGANGDDSDRISPGPRQAESDNVSAHVGIDIPTHRICVEKNGELVSDVTAARPPLQRRGSKVTPTQVAEHVRPCNDTGERCDKDPFDFEPDGNNNGLVMHSFREDWLPKDDGAYSVGADAPISDSDNEKKVAHCGSESLGESVGIRRINRSATVDAFPYHKVFPQREMPESARNLNFGIPDVSERDDLPDDLQEGDLPPFRCESAPITPTYLKADCMDGGFVGEDGLRSPLMSNGREREIAQKLFRHPSKAVSPQSPQIGRALSSFESGGLDEVKDSKTAGSGSSSGVGAEKIGMNSYDGSKCSSSTDFLEKDAEGMEPFIEVRLLGGESGLFLKICRKLKTICTTKLAAVAERQKKKTCGRRSLTALRRTASARSLRSEADVLEVRREEDLLNVLPRLGNNISMGDLPL